MEPGNQWFVTGSADRTIKVMNIILLLLGSLYSVFSTNQLKDKTQTQPSMVDLISDVFFFLLQTCQPLIKENLETYEKNLGDSTKSSEIPFFSQSR